MARKKNHKPVAAAAATEAVASETVSDFVPPPPMPVGGHRLESAPDPRFDAPVGGIPVQPELSAIEVERLVGVVAKDMVKELKVPSPTADIVMQIESVIQQARPLVERTWPHIKRALHAVSKSVADFTAPPKGEPDWRDWQIDFGQVTGKAGEIKRLEVEPQCHFKGEKIMATDTGVKPGMGTRIGMILVADKMQRPVSGNRTPTLFFANGSIGNGTRWDPCRAGLKVVMEVEFVEDCEFTCTVFGKAVPV